MCTLKIPASWALTLLHHSLLMHQCVAKVQHMSMDGRLAYTGCIHISELTAKQQRLEGMKYIQRRRICDYNLLSPYCTSKQIIPQEHECPCIELWDFPVILTFDHDPLSPTSQTCRLVNLVVMRVTHQHFRGSPNSKSSVEG